MRALTGFLLAGLACAGLAQPPEVGGGGEEWTDVANPCLNYRWSLYSSLLNIMPGCADCRCGGGRKCVPIVNGLLQMPVAHCTGEAAEEQDGEPCSSREVGVSLMSCRTQDQWAAVASTACGLGRASVEVHHPCHRRRLGSPAIFLQATIACCPLRGLSEAIPTVTQTTPTTPEYKNAPLSVGYENIHDGKGDSGDDQKGAEGYGGDSGDDQKGEEGYGVGAIVIVTLGSFMTILVVIIATTRYLRYRRSRRSVTLETSVV